MAINKTNLRQVRNLQRLIEGGWTDSQKKAFAKLTDLQQKFCINLLKNDRQVDAYRKAGGMAKSGNAQRRSASVMRSGVNVASFMEEIRQYMMSDSIMTRREALEKLSVIGRGSMVDLLEFKNACVTIDHDGNKVFQTVWTIKDSAMMDNEQLQTIAELTAGKDGIKIKQHSPLVAIKLLADMEGWLAASKSELSGPGGVPLEAPKMIIQYIDAEGKETVSPESDDPEKDSLLN